MVRCTLRFAVAAALGALLAACDGFTPAREAVVLEAFVETGQPLPPLRVTQTGAAAPVPVEDAEAVLTVGASRVAFAPVPGEPGAYRATRSRPVAAGEVFVLEVDALGRRLHAASAAPARIRLVTVRAEPASEPVRALLADGPGGAPRPGFVYRVDVTLTWEAPPAPDTAWVRVRLRPPPELVAPVVDPLLRTDDTRPERTLPEEDGRRVWRGVYAVPVAGPESAFPAHPLEASVLRSGSDYARFALSRNEPGAREPVGNVRGGLGIVAGVSVDRRTVAVSG